MRAWGELLFEECEPCRRVLPRSGGAKQGARADCQSPGGDQRRCRAAGRGGASTQLRQVDLCPFPGWKTVAATLPCRRRLDRGEGAGDVGVLRGAARSAAAAQTCGVSIQPTHIWHLVNLLCLGLFLVPERLCGCLFIGPVTDGDVFSSSTARFYCGNWYNFTIEFLDELFTHCTLAAHGGLEEIHPVQ